MTRIVDCHNIALSNKPGRGEIVLADHLHSGLGALSTGKGRISVHTVDQLYLTPPTLLKIDVEHHELSVLQGAMKTITVYRPMIVFEHLMSPLNTRASLNFLTFLQSLGYNLFVATWQSLRPLEGTLLLTLIDESATNIHKLRFTKVNIFACPKEKSAFKDY